MKDATRVVRAGLPDVRQGEAFQPGPTFAGTYHLTGDPASSPYTYGRYHNPTWTAYEKAISELEGAHPPSSSHQAWRRLPRHSG